MTDKVTSQDHAKEAGETARLLSFVLILLASAGLFISALAIPDSRFERLGAGAFPQMVFVALMFMSTVAIVDALRKISRPAYGRFLRETVAWVRRRHLVFVVLAALGTYIAMMPMLGFSVASFIFILGVELVLMPRDWKTMLIALIVAIVFSFGLNWLFAEVFDVFLPRGDR